MAMNEDGKRLDARAKLLAGQLSHHVYSRFMQTLHDRRISQRELCDKHGVDTQWLNTTLKSQNFTLRTLFKLSEMIGVSVLELLSEDPEMAG